MGKIAEILVMGNPSGDMDSIASAIALSSALGKGYLPLINIPRDELFLRKDVLFLFDLLKIDPATLHFQEDLPSLLTRITGVILVDHNALSPGQEELAPFVRRIFDHHRDEQASYPGLESKMIAKTGSSATLILDAIKQKDLTPELALLLLAPLLLDTSNFQDTRKVTAKDRKAFQVLLSRAGALVPPDFYETLLENKLYADPARPDLLLKKDCKLYREGSLTYGISSLPKSIAWTLDNDVHWQEDQLTFLREQKVPLWVILEWLNGGKAVIFTTPSPELKQALVEHILEYPHLREVFDIDSFQFQDEFVFYRLKVPLPRKELQPLLAFEKMLF
jgi:exopolyphosphatase